MCKINIGLIPSSPIGPLWVAVSEEGLFAVEFDVSETQFTQQVRRRAPHAQLTRSEPLTTEARQQITEYLDGKRQVFDLSVDLSGLNPFQQSVLQVTASIPYGEVTTYKQIATLLGRPQAARAVGRAEATNPMPLVIPCHRVLGSDGKLHGYGGPGGIEMKAWLLKLEQSG
jgi:O-6-methylguanine DNA methyltransferase